MTPSRGPSLKISQVIDFLEGVKTQEGDIKLQSVTGFWVETVKVTGERVVVPCVGDAQSLNDLLIERGE